jgi:hypothetical protein
MAHLLPPSRGCPVGKIPEMLRSISQTANVCQTSNSPQPPMARS